MFLIANKKAGTRAFATVWEVEDKGKYSSGRISTSEKDNREAGKYINSNWFCRFVGDAYAKSLTLQNRDRIDITAGKVSNTSSKGEDGKWQNYLNVTIFDFDKYDGGNSPMEQPPAVEPSEDNEDLPY